MESLRLHCGHTFCRQCLEAHLTYVLNAFVADKPGFDQVLPNLRLYYNALADITVDEGTRRRLRQELAIVMDNTAQPTYSCPACRCTISSKPTRELLLRMILEKSMEHLGEQNPEHAGNAGIGEHWHFFLLL